MTRWSVASLVYVMALGSCSGSARDADAPRDGDASNTVDADTSGTTDGGEEQADRCPNGYELGWTAAVPTDPDRQCVDSAQAEVIGVCLSSQPQWGRFFCYRRKADSKEFWLNPGVETHPDSTAWEPCKIELPTAAAPLPPRPCFTTACPVRQSLGQPYVYSTCSELMTKDHFSCGKGDRVWDENCCLRARCTLSDECGPNGDCRNSILGSIMYCWLVSSGEPSIDPNRCSCAGSVDGPPQGYCFTKP